MEGNKKIYFNNGVKVKSKIKDKKTYTFDRLCNLQKLIKRESIEETSKLIQGLYRGYILPFNDTENILDEESYLIVKSL